MHVTIQIFVVLVVVVFVVSCNWFFPANHKSVSVLFLFTCILYCIAFLLLREAFLRMRIPSILLVKTTREGKRLDKEDLQPCIMICEQSA